MPEKKRYPQKHTCIHAFWLHSQQVGNLIFELNYDNQAKEILEGQRRYREQMNSQYTAGYTDAEEKYEAVLAERDIALAEKDASIAEQAAAIAKLQEELKKYKNE